MNTNALRSTVFSLFLQGQLRVSEKIPYLTEGVGNTEKNCPKILRNNL